MKKWYLTFCIYLCFLLNSFAATLIVPDDLETIQSAIDSSSIGDTIVVKPGNYFENLVIINKNINLFSLYEIDGDTAHISNTIIDGGNTNSVLSIQTGIDSTCIISGFTITNGFHRSAGAGINLVNASPVIRNCILTNNGDDSDTSPSGIGGISCYLANPKIQSLIITQNYGPGLSAIYSKPVITDCIISKNMGSGINLSGTSQLTCSETIIKENKGFRGGGIYSTNATMRLDNITICNNAASYGGGMFFTEDATIESSNNVNIYLNKAYTDGNDLLVWQSSIYDTVITPIEINIDTFTVKEPDDFFVAPDYGFNLNIENAKIEKVSHNLYVSPNGSDQNSGQDANQALKSLDFALIKSNADSLNPQTIYLSSGKYSSSTTGEQFPVRLRSYVTLEGESDSTTILDIENQWETGIVVINCDSISISNMTVQNGFEHGGISIKGSSIKMNNLFIHNNTGYTGGGIYFANSYLEVKNLIVANNSRVVSGCGGIKIDYCTGYLKNILFDSNVGGNQNEEGGGMAVFNSALEMDSLEFINNISGTNGGGLYMYDSDISISNSTFENNSALYGGGLACENTRLLLSNTRVTNNHAENAGGGLVCYQSSPRLHRVTFEGNTTANWGAAISCSENSSPVLSHVTTIHNTADQYGGGIFCWRGSNPVLVNSILWDDVPQSIAIMHDEIACSLAVSHSMIDNGYEGMLFNDNDTINWMDGNIVQDPLFYQDAILSKHSPCIDAGTTELIFDSDTLWIDKNYDYIGTAPDMGAIEFDPLTDISPALIPETFSVHLSSYPNPFNSSTMIEFGIDKQQELDVSIYNMLGQKVKQLVNKTMDAGEYKFLWDGKNNYGNDTSSGIYLVVFTGNINKNIKILYLK